MAISERIGNSMESSLEVAKEKLAKERAFGLCGESIPDVGSC